MRNIKRAIAIVVVVTLLAMTSLPSFAAESYLFADKATILGNLNLVDGSGTDANGNKTFQLGASLDRQTGITMLIKMFGKKADAEALKPEEVDDALDKYTDVGDVADWASKYVAYSVKNGMVLGTSATKLSPEAQLDGKTLSTMILRQLGYTVSGEQWKTAANMLAEKGGLSSAYASQFNDLALNQDKMYGVAYYSLFAANSEGNTLAKMLVDDSVVTADDLKTELGTDYDKAIPKAIKSVAAVEAQSIALNGTVSLPATVNVTYDDDTTGTAAVTWDTSVVDKTKAGTYEVSGTVAGYATPIKVNVTVKAATLEIESATATSLKEVIVKFNNELVKASAEDETLYEGIDVSVANLQADNRTVILTVKDGSELSTDEEYELTVSGVEDTSGNVLAEVTKTFVANDTTIPQAVSAIAKGNSKVLVIFSEPVEKTGAEKKDNYAIDGTSVDDLATTAPILDNSTTIKNGDSKTVIITLDKPLLEGDHTLTLTQGDATDVVDYAGYKAAASTKTFKVASDNSVPTVTKIEANSQTKATITFSEEMDDSNTSFTLGDIYWNSTGSIGSITKKANDITDIGNNQWEVSFNDGTNYMATGKGYIFVKDVTDLNGNNIQGNVANNTYKAEVTVTANVIPTVKSVKSDADDKITITFTDDVDKTTAETKANYTVKDKDGDSYTFGTPVLDAADASVVTLTMTSKLAGGTYTVTTSANIKDTVGNKLAASTNDVAITDTTAPTVASITYKGEYIVVTYNEDMMTSGAYSAASKTNYKYDGTVLGTGSSVTTISNKIFKIKLPSAVTAGETLTTGYISGSSVNAVSDTAGNILQQDNTIPATPATDVDITTDVSSIKITDDATLEVIFKKPVSKLIVSDFSIAGENPVSVALDDDCLTATFTMEDGTFSGTDTITDVAFKTIASGIESEDVFGSKLKSVTTAIAPTTFKNEIAASLKTGAIVNANMIILTVDGLMAAQDDNMKTSIKVIQDDSTKAINTITQKGQSQFNIALTDAIDTEKAVTIKTLSATNIDAVDKNGNTLEENTTGITIDKFAPVGLAIDSTNKKVAITFNKNIKLDTIDSGLTAVDSSVSLKAAYDNTAKTVTVPGVGVIGNITLDAATGDVNCTITVTSNKVITLNFTDNTVTEVVPMTYTPEDDITDTSSGAINDSFTLTKY